MKRLRGSNKTWLWEKAVQAGSSDRLVFAFLGSHYFNSSKYEKAADYLGRRLATGKPDKTLRRYMIVGLIRCGAVERPKEEIRAYWEQYGLDDDAGQLVLALVCGTNQPDQEARLQSLLEFPE